jgi:hypothetical protein
MVLTETVQISMWWTNLCLRIRGLIWNDTRVFCLSLPGWQRLSQLWQPTPPARIDRERPTGKHKQQQRDQRYQNVLDELSHGPSLTDRLFRREPKIRHQRLLLRALQIAATLATTGIPSITLSGDRAFRRTLRRYKRRGFLGTTNLRADDLSRLRQVLSEYEPHALYSSPNSDGFHLIVDTGCSQSATSCLDDFLPGTLLTLPQPLEMEGIAGGLVIRQQGRVRYEILTDDGNVHPLETTAYYIPELPCRLFSPQAHFQGLFQSGLDPRETCNLPSNATTAYLLGKRVRRQRLTFARRRIYPVFVYIARHLIVQKLWHSRVV